MRVIQVLGDLIQNIMKHLGLKNRGHVATLRFHVVT